MHFYLPRRHRRKLLFPPGLLALAGLLWLGCMFLYSHAEQLKQQRIIQLIMLPLDLSRPAYRGYETLWPTLLSSPAKIAAYRPWKNGRFIGNSRADTYERGRLSKIVHTMMTDTMRDGGVRICFSSTAHYKDLVFILDLMNRENVKKYWLDMHHKPTAFYAYTTISEAGPYPICGIRPFHYIPPPTSFWVDFDNCAVNFWQFTWLKPLTQSEWRPSIYLFAAIALLSTWRMVRSHRNSTFS